jgi:hypothetical protein
MIHHGHMHFTRQAGDGQLLAVHAIRCGVDAAGV